MLRPKDEDRLCHCSYFKWDLDDWAIDCDHSLSEYLRSTRANITELLYLENIAMAARTAKISRKTNETDIEVYINLDCQPGSASQQIIDVSTGIGFLDHVRSPPNLAFIYFYTLREINVIHGDA